METKMVDKEKIMSELLAGVTTVVFTKQNGERRVMKCTLNEKLINEGYQPYQPAWDDAAGGWKNVEWADAVEKKEDLPYQPVWDIEAGGWRAFKWATVITEDTKDE
jgi:hypothetical protein